MSREKTRAVQNSTVLADHIDVLDDDFTEEWMTKEIEVSTIEWE